VIVGHFPRRHTEPGPQGPGFFFCAIENFRDQKFFLMRSKISIVEQAHRYGLLVAFSATNRCTLRRKMLYAHSRSFSKPL
jgi:hypothetical protein